MKNLFPVPFFLLLILIVVSFSGCTPAIETTDEILFTEIMTGKSGNNNFDFIEIFNPGDSVINLEGYEIKYLLEESGNPETLFKFTEFTLIAPKGFILLGHDGQDFGTIVDGTFSTSLVPARGGLQIFNPEGQISDVLGWGEAPKSYFLGQASQTIESGSSLQRNFDNQSGEYANSHNNRKDYSTQDLVNPSNSGVLLSDVSGLFKISCTVPSESEPGQPFDIIFNIKNNSDEKYSDLVFLFRLNESIEITSSMKEFEQIDNDWQIKIDEMNPGETLEYRINVSAPWIYTDISIHSYYITDSNHTFTIMGQPALVSITGGSIPIQTARNLFNQELIVEGTATMYTDGFYAGSSGTKFYIQDETGGIQVYISGGKEKVNVSIGDRVQVKGVLELYRGSLELIPISIEDVSVLTTSQEYEPVLPIDVSLASLAENADDTIAQLISVEGTVSRVEEFSYSYEIDLMDEVGHLSTFYLDKETGIIAEGINAGETWRITGIVEKKDDSYFINPRLQEDLVKVTPPSIVIESISPIMVSGNENIELVYEITNYTDTNLEEISLSFSSDLPVDQIHSIYLGENRIETMENHFVIQSLKNGESTKLVLSYIPDGADFIEVPSITAASSNWPEPAEFSSFYIFIDTDIPIWAIQGSGYSSPYALKDVITSGVVTGIFPELEGFWIQNPDPDQRAETSEGLFVQTAVLPEIKTGDMVRIFGKVHESFQQTIIEMYPENGLIILSEDHDMPEAIELDPPANYEESLMYYEELEGMLVTIDENANCIAPTNKYGETVFSLEKHNQEHVYYGQPTGLRITIDDGSNITHLDQSTYDYQFVTGDTLTKVSGPLAFTYGVFKIEPLTLPIFENRQITLPDPISIPDDSYAIMSWNVENLFDNVDPHPSSPPMPGYQEYKTWISKIAASIQLAGYPQIIALQEVENIEILEDIVEHEILAEHNYEAVLIEGFDSRGIDVGYLVSTEFNIVRVEQFNAPGGLTSRPPLLLEVEKDDTHLYILNNHFLSMSGGEIPTEPRRTAQAEWNVEIANELKSADPDAQVIILGDLNSYIDSKPIQAIESAGFANLLNEIPSEERYTYIYQGVAQILDYMLVTDSQFGQLVSISALHINADFPLQQKEDTSPIHKSDHDPVIAIFNFN